MDLASALTTEGPLEKQSPNVLKIYQTRYFAIRGKGQFLVWFKKKPVNPDQDPKGILKIETISQILQGGSDDRYFSIVYLQRTFNFRAQSVSTKQRWVKALQTILTHIQKQNKNKIKLPQNTTQSWKWKNNTNQQISQQIRLENQEVILTDASSQIGKKSQEFLGRVMKDRSVFQIQKCIVYGFYLKKKIVSDSERWYFLASGVNLKDDKDQQLYTATQQFLQQLKTPKQEQKQTGTKKKQNDSSDSQQQAQQQKKQNKNLKELRINCLFEYDPQTKNIKYCYNVIDMISFELKTNQQPFQLKIVYEEATDNQQDEEIKENQIILMSNFLIEVKKLHSALKIISEKYNMHKHRQQKNANKSKRYPIKRWRFLSEDQWRVGQQKNSLYILLNKKMLQINAIGINLQWISSHSKESIKIKGSESSNTEQSQLQKQKKQQVLYLTYKKQQEQHKVYIQFDSLANLNKFSKKLGRNIKKMQELIQAQNRDKIVNRKEEEKKVNQDTYLIDKKIRETNSSIKVNFYEMMDRELVAEKKEDIKEKGFFDKIMAMFCAVPSPFQTTPAATANK